MLRAILAAVLLLAAPLAHANPLRMHGTPAGGVTPPDLIVQMFPTQTKILDLTSVTTHCNTSEFLSVTPVGIGGAVNMEVDRGQTLLNSTTETWRKSELVNNTGYSADSDHQALNLVHTDSASVGTGAATLNILCTSTGLTKVVRIDVVAGPQVDWNYGVETTVRYGGYPLGLLPGPVTRYTTTDTNWEVWGQHLMIKCSGNTTQCPVADTGPLYQTSGAANAITLVAGTQVDVVVHDSSGPDITIHMHPIAHQRDIAPIPLGGGWTHTDFGQSQTCLITQTPMHYGDTVMHEGARVLRTTYGPYTTTVLNNACVLGFPRVGARTQYSGGPIPDFAVSGVTCSVAGNLCYSAPYSSSLITWDCREVWECDYGMMWDVEENPASHIPTNLRFTHFNTAGVSNHQGVYIYAANPPNSAVNFQVDHMKADTITTQVGGAEGSYAYFLDNWVQGTPSGNFFAYCNSIVAGNRVLRPQDADAFHLAIQACNDGSVGDLYPSFSWNWINGLWLKIDNHLDFAQGDWSTGGLNKPLGNNYVYKVVGNLEMGPPFHIYDCSDVKSGGTPGTFYPTCSGTTGFIGLFTNTNCPNGICANGTYRSEDGQPYLMHDGTISGATVEYNVYGNYGGSVFGQGINTTTVGPASVIAYNAFGFSNKWASTSPPLNNLVGSGFNSPTIINFAPGAIFTADGNVVTENTIQWVDAGVWPAPGIDTPLVSNLDSTNGCSSATTCLPNLNPTYGVAANFANRMQPNLDAWIVAGVAAGHGPGAVVDIRGRKVTNPSAVAPHAGISLLLPYCTVAPTIAHTGTGQAAASFTGTIAGTALAASSITGTIAVGQGVSGTGVTVGTTIVSGSGSAWVVTPSQTAGPVTMGSGDIFSISPAVTWTQTTGTKQSGWQLLYQANNAFAAQLRGPSFSTNTTYTLTTTDLAITHDAGTSIFLSYLEYTGLVTNVGSNLCQSTSFAID
jgi:hypothetical protein